MDKRKKLAKRIKTLRKTLRRDRDGWKQRVQEIIEAHKWKQPKLQQYPDGTWVLIPQ